MPSRKITDDQTELFDVVDKNDNVIGQATRVECHKNPKLIHRIIGIVIFNNKGEILLQRRSKTKDLYPRYWGLSAGGHVEKGSSYEEAAGRELKEELKMSLTLKFMGKIICEAPLETEMMALFKITNNGPFDYGKTEIEEVRFFKPEELRVKVSAGEVKLTPKAEIGLKALKIL